MVSRQLFCPNGSAICLSVSRYASILLVVLILGTTAGTAASQTEPIDVGPMLGDGAVFVNFVDSPNQDRETVQVQAVSTADWIEMKPKNAGAKFKMITKPRYLERVFKAVDDQPSIKMRSYISTFDDGDGLMVFMYSDLPIEPTGKAIFDTLEGIALGSVTNLNGKITQHEKIRYKDYPGVSYEFRFAKDEQLHGGVGRAFLVGKRQFVVSVMMKEARFDQATALAFFESFRIAVDEEEESDQIQKSSDK